jgi:hypothetical protein
MQPLAQFLWHRAGAVQKTRENGDYCGGSPSWLFRANSVSATTDGVGLGDAEMLTDSLEMNMLCDRDTRVYWMYVRRLPSSALLQDYGGL